MSTPLSGDLRKKKRPSEPPSQGIWLATKKWFYKQLDDFVYKAGGRLEVQGAAQAQETQDGGLMVFSSAMVAAETPDPGEPGLPPDGHCPCQPGANIVAKMTRWCGASLCCGVPYFEEGVLVGTAGTYTWFHEGLIYDNTTGTLVTRDNYGFIRTRYDDSLVEGSCVGDYPDCGDPVITEEQIEPGPFLPECEGAPDPGFKCYQIFDTSEVFDRYCYWSQLPDAAIGAAVSETEAEFTDFEPVGETAFLQGGTGNPGFASWATWEIKRNGQRIPVHLVFVVSTQLSAGGSYTEEEIILTIPANVNTAVFELELPADGYFSQIESLEIHYGRIPTP